MKNTLLVIVVLLVSACATTPTMKSIVGTYAFKEDGYTFRMVLLENGIGEIYMNSEKGGEGKWKITKEGEIHATDADSDIGVIRINKDGSITTITYIPKDGKRVDGISKGWWPNGNIKQTFTFKNKDTGR